MLLYVLKLNQNAKMPEAYGKYYAYPVITQTVDIDGLAEHMASHNTPFSKGAIKGMITDMVSCVKELTLQGFAVKIDDLAIFSIGIRNKEEPLQRRSSPSPRTSTVSVSVLVAPVSSAPRPSTSKLR